MNSVNTSSRRTEGATLFVVVLMVLFLLAAVMAITAQLTLSGRKSTGDQENSLRAQYAAESTVARAQARMVVLNRVLTSTTSPTTGTLFGVVIPKGTYTSAVSDRIMALCSISNMPLPSGTTPLCGSDTANSNIFHGNTPTDAQMGLFNTFVSQAALVEAGAPVTDQTSRELFWREAFGGASNGASLGGTINNVATAGRSGLVINKVMQVGRDAYKIFITIPEVNVKSQSVTSVQSMKLVPPSRQYVLFVGRKNFSDYALMTNHHYANESAENTCQTSPTSSSCRISFTNKTAFTGPVHTNQQFAFGYDGTGTGSGATFAGPVTSAGCKANGIGIDADKNPICKSGFTEKGAYYKSGSSAMTLASESGSILKKNGEYVKSPLLRSNTTISCPGTFCTQPSFNGGVDWGAPFVQLPPDSSSQVSDAQGGGLFISNGVSDLSLSVSDLSVAGGASQHMQIVKYTKIGAAATELAINPAGKVYLKVAGVYKEAVQSPTSFEWVDKTSTEAAGSKNSTFNGVVYVDSKDGIKSFHGPARTTESDPASSGPAISKSMQMTVISSGSIQITGDLKYEERPCDTVGNCPNTSATNVLGIYAAGNVDPTVKSDVVIVSPDSIYKPATGVNAPENVNIDGVLMSRSGSVRVDGFDRTSPTGSDRGRVYLTGGIIENYYGAFGTFGLDQYNRPVSTGYGRNFVYDKRMGAGLTPPSFPGTNIWESEIQDPAGNTVSLDLKSGTLVRQSLKNYVDSGGE